MNGQWPRVYPAIYKRVQHVPATVCGTPGDPHHFPFYAPLSHRGWKPGQQGSADIPLEWKVEESRERLLFWLQ